MGVGGRLGRAQCPRFTFYRAPTCSSNCWVVFEAGRTIKSFSDGKTEAGKMISLGADLSLEVRSVT